MAGHFVLELDAMVESKNGNSGVQTRSHYDTEGHTGKVYGRQMEIDPSDRSWTGGVYDEQINLTNIRVVRIPTIFANAMAFKFACITKSRFDSK